MSVRARVIKQAYDFFGNPLYRVGDLLEGWIVNSDPPVFSILRCSTIYTPTGNTRYIAMDCIEVLEDIETINEPRSSTSAP